MKKLICHCGEVELEIKESEGALNKFLRCNCTLCKKGLHNDLCSYYRCKNYEG